VLKVGGFGVVLLTLPPQKTPLPVRPAAVLLLLIPPVSDVTDWCISSLSFIQLLANIPPGLALRREVARVIALARCKCCVGVQTDGRAGRSAGAATVRNEKARPAQQVGAQPIGAQNLAITVAGSTSPTTKVPVR
jgi:hypothetical protein